jgi:transcription antitermination factor NusG
MTAYPRWYAVHAPGSEEAVYRDIKRIGLFPFLPFHRVRRRRRRPGTNAFRIEWVTRPYFTGYLFAGMRSPAESIYRVADMNGVACVVSFGGEPLEIPHAVMDEIMAMADEDGMIGEVDTTVRPQFHKGDEVTFVDNSPFASLIGKISLDDGKKVKALLKMLGASREVTISPRAVADIAQ